MKIIEESHNKLIIRDKDFFTKLWGVMAILFSTAGLYLIFNDYNPNLKPAVFVCIVFLVVGLFVLLFVNKNLTYKIDKVTNKVEIYYPVKFATTFEKVGIRIEDIKYLVLKKAIGSSSSNSKVHKSTGFDFFLKSGRKIHGGIYSTDHKKIKKLIDKISTYIGVEVLESDKIDVLF